MTARKLFLTITALIVSAGGLADNQARGAADEEPSPAVEWERHERDFRIQVYRTFRDNRAEFDRRREAWSRVRSAWNEHRGDAADEAKYIDWLNAAVRASSRESMGPLPDDPHFGAVAIEEAPASSNDSPQQTVLIPEPVMEPPPLVEDSPSADAAATPEEGAGIPHGPPAENIAPPEPPAAGIARINVSQLAAGIAGHNFGLVSVESDLLEASRPDIEQLKTALDRLEALSVRRGDLKLYYNLLPAWQRERLETLAAPTDAIMLLGNHISDLRARFESSPRATDGAHDSSIAELDGLSRRLAELATTADSN